MSRTMRRLITPIPLLLLTLILSGCDTDPVFPIEPAVSFTSISPSTGTQFTPDEVQLTFHYQDGDGDLGYEGDPVENLYVIDTRAAFASNPARVTAFSFASLTPDAKNPSIQGDITISLMTPPYEPTEEPLVFEVYIVDRAGHESNHITTTPITVQQ